ncbi:MAG: hypothetical protein ACRYFX_18745 [Janthinobacterium lividum]
MNILAPYIAAMVLVAVEEPDRRTQIRRRRGYDPGPIVNYDRSAIRAEDAARRAEKHQAKQARRAAQLERCKKK